MVYRENLYANQYQDTSKRLQGAWYLFGRWRASVFKLIWHDFLIFVISYFFLSFIYRYVIFDHPAQRELFEMICVYAGRYSHRIPITFLTGFYVSQVVSRWWDQFISLPFPDKIALKLVSFIPGKGDFHKNFRRTLMRYVNLSTILVYRLVSVKVKARFPDSHSLIEAKLLLPHEAERLEKVDSKTPHESTWAPMLWAYKLLQKARSEGKIIVEPPIFSNLISSLEYIDNCNRKILSYGFVNFPLAYTQVATFSVLSYFGAALFGRQYLVPRDDQIDTVTFPDVNIIFATMKPWDMHTPYFIVPIFTFIEFLSYMGWIKVAETLLNPFGDDDEDFRINYIIDRNLQVSYLIVDEADMELEMATDPFLEAGIDIPPILPYQKEVTKDPEVQSIAPSVSSVVETAENDNTSMISLENSKIKTVDETLYVSVNTTTTLTDDNNQEVIDINDESTNKFNAKEEGTWKL